jgi:hypothetical protein
MLEKEFAAAGNARIGCGFIAWSLANRPKLLDLVLSRAGRGHAVVRVAAAVSLRPSSNQAPG